MGLLTLGGEEKEQLNVFLLKVGSFIENTTYLLDFGPDNDEEDEDKDVVGS